MHIRKDGTDKETYQKIKLALSVLKR